MCDVFNRRVTDCCFIYIYIYIQEIVPLIKNCQVVCACVSGWHEYSFYSSNNWIITQVVARRSSASWWSQCSAIMYRTSWSSGLWTAVRCMSIKDNSYSFRHCEYIHEWCFDIRKFSGSFGKKTRINPPKVTMCGTSVAVKMKQSQNHLQLRWESSRISRYLLVFLL
jgi:hypothetical protein